MAQAAITYTWQGKDKHGQVRKGEIPATSLSEAKNLLRRQGISVSKVKKLSKPLLGGQKVTPADISVVSSPNCDYARSWCYPYSVVRNDCSGSRKTINAKALG